ncbi:MAG: hypothetical protein HOC91_01375 [Nitrospinaceae bacterium]|jgi:MEMO1 family protein|nr:hypothetical protein [Nitrospinaceae bacterium]MBT3820847.1 hypothetical protein [Nitrospinaceae bacterium]MBT4093802.1 hypothetical protein [Nitrospinaceae bacterium]MBT4429145.1 hypothetical protein [Nitrospinaceae bacterium]MBT5368029.1 hypothetical protein [Nitrospinaceae bacterium]
MSGVELGFMVPHPWIMVAGELEEGHHALTTSAYRQVRDQVAKFAPDVMIVASPHWPILGKYRIGGAPRYKGTLDTFLPHINEVLPPEHRRDLPPVPYDFPGDTELAGCLFDAGKEAGLDVQFESEPEALDHGSIVPIMYLNPEGRFPVVLISNEEGSHERSRKWGEVIEREIERIGRRAVFIASGTLSHHFVFDSPDALWPDGEVWDRKLLDTVTKGCPEDIFSYTDTEIAGGELEAGGLHGLYMLLGALGPKPSTKVLSYEGIVGVGSPIIEFERKILVS